MQKRESFGLKGNICFPPSRSKEIIRNLVLVLVLQDPGSKFTFYHVLSVLFHRGVLQGLMVG